MASAARNLLPTATNGVTVNDEDDMEIQKFMTGYNKRMKQGRRDIPVKELRHIIPRLTMYCFFLKEDQPTKKKYKGMWERLPTSWNPKVPFRDPNNKGNQGKPNKEILMQMIEYLVKVYQKTTSADDNWNPLQDCQQRIKNKLHFIENNTHMSNADINLLNVIEGVLFRLGKKDPLMHAHEFECTLDIVKDTNTLSAELSQKWRKFEAENKKLIDDPHTLESTQLLTDEHPNKLDISVKDDALVYGQTEECGSNVSLTDTLVCSGDNMFGISKEESDHELVIVSVAKSIIAGFPKDKDEDAGLKTLFGIESEYDECPFEEAECNISFVSTQYGYSNAGNQLEQQQQSSDLLSDKGIKELSTANKSGDNQDKQMSLDERQNDSQQNDINAKDCLPRNMDCLSVTPAGDTESDTVSNQVGKSLEETRLRFPSTKRCNSNAGNQRECKRRRTKDMDIEGRGIGIKGEGRCRDEGETGDWGRSWQKIGLMETEVEDSANLPVNTEPGIGDI